MSASNPYTSFTITQPFLGAPLQFQPALGSKELEELVDIYVVGPAAKQDKLSQVTIDFYNNATVDLNTGALVKKYDVFPSTWAGQSFEQSPTQSQSSGFSPPIFTPSPGSSATFGDSGYGSISLTPPNRSRGGRVAKKPKKETKKDAEIRLPGFSIMTRDGVDVTSTAGRGTKTKEQREHAHLMRIMKACADCKRKKIRCDPSHRRSHNDMSRTSTSTTKTSSSRYQDPSPTSTAASSSRQVTYDSPSNMPSFSSSSGIDDFVLFPEDSNSSFWNSTDLSFPELESQDLSQFNFDINDIDLTDFPSAPANQFFDFSFHQQPSSLSSNSQLPYTPSLTDQYGLDEWAEPQGYMPISHSRPHPSSSTQDSGQLDSNYQSGWLRAESEISPRTSTFADNYWPDGSLQNPQIAQHGIANESPMLSATSDWSILENSLEGDSPPQHNSSGSQSGAVETRKRQYSHSNLLQEERDRLANGISDPSGHGEFVLQSGEPVFSTSQSHSSRKRPAAEELVRSQNTGGLSPIIRSSDSGILVDPSNPSGSFTSSSASSSGNRQGADVLLCIGRNDQLLERLDSANANVDDLLSSGPRSTQFLATNSLRISQAVHQLANVCVSLSRSLRAIPSPSVESRALTSELQQLGSVLGQLLSGTSEQDVPEPVLELIQTTALQLQVLSSHVWQLLHSGRPAHQSHEPLEPVFRQEFYRESQTQARRLVRSLCATINRIQVQNSRASPSHSPANGNTTMFTSGRNLQLFAPSSGTQNLLQDNERQHQSLLSGVQIPDDSSLTWESSRISSGGIAVDGVSTVLLREKSRAQLHNIVPDVDGVWVASEKSEVGEQQLVASRLQIPQFSSILLKAEQTDLDRPYLLSADVQRSAAPRADLEIALLSETPAAEIDEMHVEHPVIATNGEQTMPPFEFLTRSPPTPLRRTWSSELIEVIPSHNVQETSPSSILQIIPFDHNQHADSSGYPASSSGMHYSIAIAVALLGFSILLSTSKTFSPLLLLVQQLGNSWVVADDDSSFAIATIAKLFLTATIVASPHYFTSLFQSANSFACLAMATLSLCGNSERCSAFNGKDVKNSSKGMLSSKSLTYGLDALWELSPVVVVG